MVKAHCRGTKGGKTGTCATKKGPMGTTYATNTGKRTGKTYVRQHERKKKK